MLLQVSDWRRCLVAPDELPPASGPWLAGVDLGGSASLNALAAYWPETSRAEVLALVGDDPPLLERGRLDGVGRAYLEAHRRGELLTAPGRDPGPGRLIQSALERWGPPAALAADRWKKGRLYDALNEAGAPRRFDVHLRGQGYRDGGEDVAAFRRSVHRGLLQVSGGQKLLGRAIAGARVLTDPAGNSKLATRADGGRSWKHRDDMAAALILACGLGERWRRAAA